MRIDRRGGPAIALLGLIAFGAAVAWYGIVGPQSRGEAESSASALPSRAEAVRQDGDGQAARPPQDSPPSLREIAEASQDRVRSSMPLPAEQAKTGASAEPGKASGPSFDIVRIEPTGESVIAGRGPPGATIEMLRNGRTHARALADTSGLFAFVPPLLKPGSHEIGLTSIAPDGTRAQSRESVTVVIGDDATTKPLVTLTSPDRPTVVLSAPDSPDPKRPQPSEGGAGAGDITVAKVPPAVSGQPIPPNPGAPPPAARSGVRIVSVEAEEGGRLFVSGDAAAGATIRLYLNDSFIAPGGTGQDGKVSFAIGRGVRPGDYRVRLDDVDPVSGDVKSRAEVAFNVPPPLMVPLPPLAQPLAPEPDLARVPLVGQPGLASPLGQAPAVGQGGSAKAPLRQADQGVALMPNAVAGASELARGVAPGTVVVPQVTTATVSRGDNLWRISQRIYGEGKRYTVIYDANQTQIRNPNRVYPGQIFVLPAGQQPVEPPRTKP